ncbi:MAG: TIGR04283 family arsenosugar biosynthesis glycosyltransferase [Gemmatimonadota bacterium]|nr:TIGR04283 family arsenosugar biosynthesis glycosyltransferase [Gemmatimonadota bacterium]
MADKPPPAISVIIPTYNEEGKVGWCLKQFHDASDQVEIILVDGGSSDQTVTIAEQASVGRVVHSTERGRAAQMNRGAVEAKGDLFLFLHADTLLPDGWVDLISVSIYDRGMIGGRFRLSISDSGFVYRLITFGSNFRSRRFGVIYGDQAIYTSRDMFAKTGGFPPTPVFEDSEFCDLLKQEGCLDWIDVPVVTSSRRWKRRGPVRTVLLTWCLRILYSLSVSPETLTRYYRAVR